MFELKLDSSYLETLRGCHALAKHSWVGPAGIGKKKNMLSRLLLTWSALCLLPHMCNLQKNRTGCSACRACRVRDFEIIDIFPYGINFAWDKDGERIVSTLFERNGPIPSAKMLTFFRCRP